MRRILIALSLSIAAVAPGIARRAQDHESPPNWRRNREPIGSPERSERWRQPMRERHRGMVFEDFGLCQPTFRTDISYLLFNAPGQGWVVVPGDCSDQAGCRDYFVFSCDPGSLVQASFCSHGGQAFWNTNLSVWDSGNLEACEDDSCGQQSEIAYTYSGDFFHRLRLGGTNDESGAYSLAVNIPANCAIGDPIGVELQGFEVR
jgi:hypothetical protein